DRTRIGARLEDKIVLQLVLIAVIDDVDARIDGAVPHARVARNIGAPVRLIAAEVIRPASEAIEPFDCGRRVRVLEQDIYLPGMAIRTALRVREGERGAVFREEQVVAAGMRGIEDIGVRLAAVRVET